MSIQRLIKRIANPAGFIFIILAVPLAMAVWSKISGQSERDFYFYEKFGIMRADCFILFGVSLLALLLWPQIRKNIYALYFGVSLIVIAIAFGFVVGRYKTYPTHAFDAVDRLAYQARLSVKDWMTNWGDNLGVRPTRHLRRSKRPGASRSAGAAPSSSRSSRRTR